MIIAVVIFALSHMGVLIFVSTSQCFARVDIAWMTLWTNVNRSYRHYIKEFVTDVSISPIFGVFSGLSLFALWRIVGSNFNSPFFIYAYPDYIVPDCFTHICIFEFGK